MTAQERRGTPDDVSNTTQRVGFKIAYVGIEAGFWIHKSCQQAFIDMHSFKTKECYEYLRNEDICYELLTKYEMIFSNLIIVTITITIVIHGRYYLV